MKIAKSWKKKPGYCAAMRCKTKAAASVVGSYFYISKDERIPLCSKHLDKANEEFKLWEVEGVVFMMNGAPLSSEALKPSTKPAERPKADTHAELVQELKKEESEASEALALLKDFKINTQEDLEFVAEALADVKGYLKRLEARRKEITDPMNAALRSVRSLFKPPIDAHKETERLLKQLISDAKAREEKENTVAIEAAAAALDDGDVETTHDALAHVRHTSNVGSIQTRKIWDFEIVDADNVHRDLCSPDRAKIKAYMKEERDDNGEPLYTPGIRFFQKTIVASGSR